jgi:hypothetical protein
VRKKIEREQELKEKKAKKKLLNLKTTAKEVLKALPNKEIMIFQSFIDSSRIFHRITRTTLRSFAQAPARRYKSTAWGSSPCCSACPAAALTTACAWLGGK